MGTQSIQDILEPAIISSDNAPSTKFQDRFDYIGTRDYTSWCAMGAALDFREMLGAAGGNMCFKQVLKAGQNSLLGGSCPSFYFQFSRINMNQALQ